MTGTETTPIVSPARPTAAPAPRWHVVLLDDDEHTYDYVIEMLRTLFQHSEAIAYRMACEVDATGRVVVATTSLERAELKRDQIQSYGPDRRLERSSGSMRSRIEQAPV